ncbi:WD40 repeat-like protein [Marasmius fiardii PR-910]|nr:WD40 repeat-like protein [Marasmius fiardii PR-910]
MPFQIHSAIPDYTELEEERSPKSRPSHASRKETILTLVEMLLKDDDGADDAGQAPTFDNDKDVPTVDEHNQAAGAEAFKRFQKRINLLDKELRNFSNAARQLGSSAAILSSAFHLRTRLANILFLYRENAADLFPRRISPTPATESPATQASMRKLRKQHRMVLTGRLPHAARPTVNENIDLEDFPLQFEALARDVTTFLRCLNEFPEFTDEAVNASISSFEGDLKYWANCLKIYQGQFRYPAVQRYIQDLASEMGEHIDSITASLNMFIEVGVPTIRFAQKHGAKNLLNLSTVATFFSAVTATTLQFSFELTSPTGHVTNSFWFLSLVFSIGAAVNSLLGLTWKQAMYRSPGHRVPWWVLIWIKRSPLVFLVLSVMCFSIGLCVFAYASHQHHVTSVITTVFTAFTSFGLVAVSLWFASERWTFLRHRGQKWLGDVLIESNQRILNMRGMGVARRVLQWFFGRFVALMRGLRLVKSSLSLYSTDGDKDDDVEANGSGLPATMPNDGTRPTSPIGRGHRFQDSVAGSSTIESAFSAPSSPAPPAPETPQSPTSLSSSSLPSPPTPTPGKQLWWNAIRAVTMRSAVSSNLAKARAREPLRRRTASSGLSTDGSGKRAEVPFKGLVMRLRVAALVPKLKCLEPVHELGAHQALVRHLQFSPNGKFLATSSWDRTSVIFQVGEKPGDPLISHRILAHAKGFVGQVAWSPNGNLLLTKLVRGIKVWTQEGVCQRTIDRPAYVESISWFPGGEAFISVEQSTVTKLDLKGRVLGEYHFGSIKLHDVAVTPDCLRLLGVGPLLVSPDGLRPSKSRVEKRLVVYNMETGQIESTTPVLNEVKDITLARNTRNGVVALVSYENKAPPQLWKMDLVKDRENAEKVTARLTLRHTYMPRVPVDFAGPSYFGGKNDELVLCAGKAGDIHIWDQESGSLLHHVRSSVLGGDLTCIAWNHAAEDPFMFATGSHDGTVRIWTKPPSEVLESNITDIPRSSSPYDFERESASGFSLSNTPLTATSNRTGPGTPEVPESSNSGETGGDKLSKERVVAFVDEPASN